MSVVTLSVLDQFGEPVSATAAIYTPNLAFVTAGVTDAEGACTALLDAGEYYVWIRPATGAYAAAKRWSVVVPEDLDAASYVLRVESLSAHTVGGPLECVCTGCLTMPGSSKMSLDITQLGTMGDPGGAPPTVCPPHRTHVVLHTSGANTTVLLRNTYYQLSGGPWAPAWITKTPGTLTARLEHVLFPILVGLDVSGDAVINAAPGDIVALDVTERYASSATVEAFSGEPSIIGQEAHASTTPVMCVSSNHEVASASIDLDKGCLRVVCKQPGEAVLSASVTQLFAGAGGRTDTLPLVTVQVAG